MLQLEEWLSCLLQMTSSGIAAVTPHQADGVVMRSLQTGRLHQVLVHRSAMTVQQAYAATGDGSIMRQTAAAATSAISSHLAMAEQMSARLTGS